MPIRMAPQGDAAVPVEQGGACGSARAVPSSPAMSDTILDVQGLSCPLPVLKANKALRGLPPGARLTVLATDPASVADFRAYCRETGHDLVSFGEETGIYRFVLRKRAEPAEA